MVDDSSFAASATVRFTLEIRAKTSFLTSKKVVQVARIGGEGGGEVIWAMPERNFFFYRMAFLGHMT